MLMQYKNIEEIKTSKGAISAERITRTKKEFLSYDAQETYFANKEILKVTDNSRIEFHVYSGDNWITGNHKINFQNKIPPLRDQQRKTVTANSAIGIDFYNELQSLKLTSGNFKFIINFPVVRDSDRMFIDPKVSDLWSDKFNNFWSKRVD